MVEVYQSGVAGLISRAMEMRQDWRDVPPLYMLLDGAKDKNFSLRFQGLVGLVQLVGGGNKGTATAYVEECFMKTTVQAHRSLEQVTNKSSIGHEWPRVSSGIGRNSAFQGL